MPVTAQTITTAGNLAPASTERTALLADLNALSAEIDTSQAAGAFTTEVATQLKDKLIDFAEELFTEMRHHT